MKWRFDGTALIDMRCNRCRSFDMMSDASFPSGPAPLTSEYYLTEAGRISLIKWQSFFCDRLKKITLLKNPDRCFVHIANFVVILVVVVDAFYWSHRIIFSVLSVAA
jgi:hypothetical protein